MMILSIVIPIYNGEKVVSTCLDSIWAQGVADDEYEVICVDDCSADDTYNFLLLAATARNNMQVLHNSENLRAGGARNYGVREAKGEYIIFIDADDYFHPGALRQAIDYVRGSKLDILMCDNVRHIAGEETSAMVHNIKNQSIMSGVDFLSCNGLPWSPWKYLFKRSLMIDNSVWFVEKVSCEDVDWSYTIAKFAKQMQYQPILLTHFVLTDNSQTASEFKNGDIIWHRFYCAQRVYDLKFTIYKNAPQVWDNITSVASMQFYQGVLYLNAFYLKSKIKRDILVEYIPSDENFHGLVRFAVNYPMLYAISSNILSPVFRLLVVLKRKIFKRQ